MDIYSTTQPAMGDEEYDLAGKQLQAFNSANGTGGPFTGRMYATCNPQQGDNLYDRYGKLAQAMTIANGG